MILNVILYFFCRIFSIIRYRYYITNPETNEVERLFIKKASDYIVIKDKKGISCTYRVLNETASLINKTMVYSWLKIEKITQ